MWDMETPPVSPGVSPDVVTKQVCVYTCGMVKSHLKKDQENPRIRWDAKCIKTLQDNAKSNRVTKKVRGKAAEKFKHKSRELAASLLGISEKALKKHAKAARQGSLRNPIVRGVRAFDLTPFA